jgi:uncharacterized protein YukE
MSPSLHVETDSLHMTARSLLQQYYHLADRLFALRVQHYRLEMAWQGGDAEEYSHQLNQLIARLQDRMEELISLGLTLSRQADGWEELDQRGAGEFRDLNLFRPGE